MNILRSTYRVATSAVAMVTFASIAQAQDVAAEPVAAEPPADVAAPDVSPAATATSGGAPATVTSARPEASKPQAQSAPPPDAEVVDEGLVLSMFADAYYNFDWNLPAQDALAYNGSTSHASYANTNGFALAYLGLDASYQHDVVGATASLRFGPASNRLIGQYGSGLTLENIWQAYVTWTPTDDITIDFGQFATIFGAEVGESWENLNYTRGALYFYMQPFWHTGVRANYQATDEIGLTAMVVNGVNSPWDDNRSPGLALQLAYSTDTIGAYLGYFGEMIEPEGKNWSHFVDLVLTGSFDDLTLIFNADLGVANFDPADSEIYWGVSLAAGYAIDEHFGVAVRGEFLSAAQNYGAEFGKSLVTGTLTLEYKPEEHVAIRLDNRLEAANAAMFANADTVFAPDGSIASDGSKVYFSTTLGVVCHTN